jgi:DNA-binding phage protein
MPLTRDFRETIMADLRRDPAYRVAHLALAIESLYNGEFSVGRRMLRDYVNGTLGFAELSKATSIPPKSLMRMLSEYSNPHADKLFAIVGHLQQIENLKVTVVPANPVRARRRTERSGAAAR